MKTLTAFFGDAKKKRKEWIPHEVKRDVMLTSKGRCFHCGKKAIKALVNKRGLIELRDESNQVFQYDHLKLEMNGGIATTDNLVISCETCNKGRKRTSEQLQAETDAFLNMVNSSCFP